MISGTRNIPLIVAFFIALALGAAFPVFMSEGRSGQALKQEVLSSGSFRAASPADLAKIQPVPAFKLTASDKSSFSPEQLKGKVWLANFFFTSCKGPCPRMVEQLTHLYRGHKDRSDFAAVSITIDPEIDTASHLAEFAGRMNVDQTIWRFLTGPKDQILKLSNDGFFLGADKNRGHSAVFVLIDRTGTVRGYYQSSDPDKMTRLEHDLDMLLAVQ